MLRSGRLFSGFLVACIALSTSLFNLASPATVSAAPTATCALTWELVSGPVASLNAITARATDDVWAVGSNGPTTLWTQHWDGASWTHVATPDLGVGAVNQSLTSVTAVSSSSAWAVGSYSPAENESHAFALHWNGTAWSHVPIPASGNTYVGSIAAAADNDVWVAGTQDGVPWLEHWNGTAWTQESNTIAGTTFNTITRVQATATHDVWLMGAYYVGDNVFSREKFVGFAHWNGAAWTLITTFQLIHYSDATEEDLDATSALGADGLWFGAHYVGPLHSRSLWESRVMRWDGSGWQTMESADYSGLWHLADANGASADDVWIVPGVVQPTTNPQSPIRHWDGSTYTLTSLPVPNGAPPFIATTAATAEDIWILGGAYNVPNPGQNYLAHGHMPCATAPAPTKITKPKKNVVLNSNKPTFKWQSVDGAFYYEMDLRRNSADTPWQLYYTIDPTYTSIKSLKPKPDYYWRVRSCNNAGCSTWTGFRKFRIAKNN